MCRLPKLSATLMSVSHFTSSRTRISSATSQIHLNLSQRCLVPCTQNQKQILNRKGWNKIATQMNLFEPFPYVPKSEKERAVPFHISPVEFYHAIHVAPHKELSVVVLDKVRFLGPV